MEMPSVGDRVLYTTNPGREASGTVLREIAPRHGPALVLIERPGGARAFRLADEIRAADIGRQPRSAPGRR